VRFQKLKPGSVRVLAICAGVVFLAGVATAAEAPAWPTHSHIVPYGGWECDRGYEERSGQCLRIEVPLHAHLSAGGHDWQCDPAFRLLEESCVRPMPEIQSFRHSE
jgi:hypothetical protein